MITLYRKNSFGIGRWCIWSEDRTIHFGHSLSLDGSLIRSTETIDMGKAGRTIQEQIESRINSRIGKMLDKGYKETTDEASTATTNQLGLITPMLAQSLKSVTISSSIIQPKLNGHRCLITKVEDTIVAYSRQGKIITTIDHITSLLGQSLAEGDTIDGELYIHGQLLQSIASLVKRAQPGSGDIKYYAYDYIPASTGPRIPYIERLRHLNQLLKEVNREKVVLTESTSVETVDEALEIYSRHLAEGYEGSILRDKQGKYEIGKRSAALLKIKPKFDTEAEVIDIVRSDTGFGLCVCKVAGLQDTFKVLAPGNHKQKVEALVNKEKYIGRRLRIEYRELTELGKPFHAVGVEWFSSI